MELISITERPAIPQAQIIADLLLHRVNASLAQRLHEHVEGFTAFWNSAETPDAILLAMGANATKFLQAAGENLEHIGSLAGIVGKTLTDFISVENFMPRRAFIPAQDGTATLTAPTIGYDAWGNLI